MLPTDTETLVRIIVEEVLRALAAPGPACAPPSPPAPTPPPGRPVIGRGLVICTGDRKLEPAIQQCLRDLQAAEIGLSALISAEFERCVTSTCFSGKTGIGDCRHDVGLDDFTHFAHEFQFLLLPCLTADVAVKAVWGLLDSAPVKTLVECLRRRLPVLLLAPDDREQRPVPWVDDLDQRWPLWIRENMHQIWRSLLDWGVRPIRPDAALDAAHQAIASPPLGLQFRDKQVRECGGARIFLTAHDIEDAQRAGETVLHLPPNATLTPEAADLAAQLGIKILYPA